MQKVKNNFGGLFYPFDARELRENIEDYMARVDLGKEIKNGLKAIIVPHAGYVYSGPVAAYGYKHVQRQEYNKAILIGPSHNEFFPGLAYSSANEWEDPFSKGGIDLIRPQSGKVIKEYNPPFEQEHSVEVQIPFLVSINANIKLCVLIAGEVKDYKLAAKEVLNEFGNDTIIIISSDLSHYYDYESAKKIDKATIDQILSLNPEVNPEQACGFVGINIVIECAKKMNWKPVLYNYRNSGDTAGGRSQVVGYASIGFYI